jgi:Arc/MetJ family transcription regulator
MRTNIALDDRLVERVMRATGRGPSVAATLPVLAITRETPEALSQAHDRKRQHRRARR